MKEALKLALELKNSASAYWTEKEILIIEKLIDSLAQLEQEPVMFGLQAANGRYGNCAYSCKSLAEAAALENPAKIGYKVIGYYTTPPKREWVGLTAQEAADCWTTSASKTWHNLEAKLKEKNN